MTSTSTSTPLVACVGIACWDLLLFCDEFPERDTELRIRRREARRGGNATNTAVILAQLGPRPVWIGTSGDRATDSESRLIAEDLATYGVIDSSIVKPGCAAPTSYIVVSPPADRTILHYRDLPELRADEFCEALVASSPHGVGAAGFDWVHFECRGTDHLLAMLDTVRSAKSSVTQRVLGRFPSPVVSLELEKPRDRSTECAHRADIVFVAREFASKHGHGAEPLDALKWAAAALLVDRPAELVDDPQEPIIIVPWGSEGSYAIDRPTSFARASSTLLSLADATPWVIHVPAVPLTPEQLAAGDPVGAGDSFIAGFIAACSTFAVTTPTVVPEEGSRGLSPVNSSCRDALRACLSHATRVAAAKLVTRGLVGIASAMERIP